MKHVWETTERNYKLVLKKWHQDTGGGSGLATLFEGWSDRKLDKDNVDIDDYDHSNRGARPPILFVGYCTQTVPYFTVIHLWDKKSDYLLSSRYDPLVIGQVEIVVTISSSQESVARSGSVSSAKSASVSTPMGCSESFK